MNQHTVHAVATWASALIPFVTALAYFASAKPVLENFRSLGYPRYMIYILAVWKLLGAVALVGPVPPVVREWAYAGLTFDYTGAFVSHWSCREYVKSIPAIVVFAILIVAYFTAPAGTRF